MIKKREKFHRKSNEFEFPDLSLIGRTIIRPVAYQTAAAFNEP